MFLKLSNGRRQIIGLDIGSSSVKMIKLERDFRGYTASAAALAEIDCVPIRSAENPDSPPSSAINKCFESLDAAKTRNVVCGISGSEVAVRQFRFPPMPAEELRDAIMHEAVQVCPFDMEESTIDFQVVSQNGQSRSKHNSKAILQDELRGILVAATNKTIMSKKSVAENNKANCVLMDVDGLAILNCVTEFVHPLHNQSIVILNVGHAFTNMIIIQNNLPPFVRDLPFAGDHIIKQIAAENNIKEDVIKSILNETRKSDIIYNQIEDSFRKTCRKLAQDIIETLRYYMTQEWSSAVEKTYICGGFAMAKGFIKLLDEVLPGIGGNLN